MIKVREARRVIIALQSQIERDEATIETIERMKSNNPQLITQRTQCEARVDLSKSILRALEHGDFAELTTFTKYITLPK